VRFGTKKNLFHRKKKMSTSVRVERVTLFLEMADLSSDFADRAMRAYLVQCKPSDGSVVENVVGIDKIHRVQHTANARVLADITIRLWVYSVRTQKGDIITGNVIGTFNQGVTISAGNNVFAIVKFVATDDAEKFLFRDGVWYARRTTTEKTAPPPSSSPPSFVIRPSLTGYDRIATIGSQYTFLVTQVIVDGLRQKCFAVPVV
jgi:hypothetical protein